ncbi:hypothetical protein RhiirA5_500954 [Rhizophagus irregularis]|uniref:F-box domain-containing protein n=1 Tax=Rhizophagus irregularis TaxID=588596 RepID=A0A2N0PJP7_9GLOM|nr:hypothetical protein RhiirA5_500954 [Rhizophagus irregularis]
MLKLNKDVLFLIAENLQDDMTSLYSCLLVNKSWCEATVPILWKIPGRMILTKKAEDKLFYVILLHLSKDSKDILKKQGIDLYTETYRPTSFNYINFWRHLDLQFLEETFSRNLKILEVSTSSMIKNELLNLFINKYTKFISLLIPENINYDIYRISWNEQCFSDLKNLCCHEFHQNSLEGLATISKSIKKLFCCISRDNNDISRIVKLIEAQKNLNEIHMSCDNDEALKTIEELLIKKADTIQHLRLDWEPVTEVLSHLVNLKILDMDTPFLFRRSKNYANPNLIQLEEISLPALKILKANLSSHKILIRLIETANVQLTTIGISHDSLKEIDEIRRLTQTIYQNCPNLRYIKLPIKDYTLTEFERLLANSQYLDGLVIDYERGFDYKDVFEILTRSSPLNLSKFKFIFTQKFRLNFKLLESFLNKWNDRQPMLLQISLVNFIDEHQWYMKRLKSLIKKYEMKGIIKKFDLNWYDKFEEFEWVQDVSQFYSLP